MATDPVLGITLITEGQAGGEVTHNDAIVILAALAHLSIEDRDATAPPGGESNGQTWLVKATATGDWAGHDAEIALYYNGWLFFTVFEGMRMWVKDENVHLLWNGSSWATV